MVGVALGGKDLGQRVLDQGDEVEELGGDPLADATRRWLDTMLLCRRST